MPLKQVKINLIEEQHAELSILAADKNLTLAQFIREQLPLKKELKNVRAAYKKHEQVTYIKADPFLLYNLAKIGTNLNQISKKLNKKEDVLYVHVLKILLEIKQKIEEIKNDN